jgi:hypothetical protein
MKIAISGPPGSKKAQLFSLLKANPWFVKNNFSFKKIDVSNHVKNDIINSQFFIFNDIIKTSIGSQNLNSILYPGILDSLAHSIHFELRGQGIQPMSTNLIAAVSSTIKHFDIVFVLVNNESEFADGYSAVRNIFTNQKNIIYLEGKNLNTTYNDIIKTITELFKKIEEKKNEDSAKWASVLREDNINTLSTNTSGV